MSYDQEDCSAIAGVSDGSHFELIKLTKVGRPGENFARTGFRQAQSRRLEDQQKRRDLENIWMKLSGPFSIFEYQGTDYAAEAVGRRLSRNAEYFAEHEGEPVIGSIGLNGEPTEVIYDAA